MTSTLEFDLRSRWTPSAEQIATAVDILQPYSHLNAWVLVPIAMNYKQFGIWNDDVEVAPVVGVFLLAAENRYEEISSALPYSTARQLAADIAQKMSIEGTGSYAVIDADASWSVFEI